eukprot:1004989-Prymnesium_polylepis.1
MEDARAEAEEEEVEERRRRAGSGSRQPPRPLVLRLRSERRVVTARRGVHETERRWGGYAAHALSMYTALQYVGALSMHTALQYVGGGCSTYEARLQYVRARMRYAR